MKTMSQLLSIPHAAEILDCSRGHVYRLITTGRLRAVEIKASGTRPKTRVRAEDLAVFIEENTRVVGTRTDWPEPRPDLYVGMARPEPSESYSTTQAAQLAEVPMSAVTAALSSGDLHGTRANPRGRWTIAAGCLTAWLERRPCEHRPEGGGAGEVRPVDGV